MISRQNNDSLKLIERTFSFPDSSDCYLNNKKKKKFFFGAGRKGMASCRNIRSLPSFILSSFFLLFSFCPSLFNNFDGLVGNKETEGKTEGGAEFALKCLLTKKMRERKEMETEKTLICMEPMVKEQKTLLKWTTVFFFLFRTSSLYRSGLKLRRS